MACSPLHTASTDANEHHKWCLLGMDLPSGHGAAKQGVHQAPQGIVVSKASFLPTI